MKRPTAYLLISMLAVAACDEGPEDSQNSGETDGDTEGGDDDASPDDDDDDDGDEDSSSEPGGDGTCVQDSPEGEACGDGGDCSVACLCTDGVVSSGRCLNGACADPADTCAEACEDFDSGDFTGTYCALDGDDDPGDDDPGDDDPGDDDPGDGAACMPTGDACEVNGDCCGFESGDTLCTSFGEGLVACADVCVFDGDCVSDCCVPVDSGLGVCGPATECF